jgi:hypothetical protein
MELAVQDGGASIVALELAGSPNDRRRPLLKQRWRRSATPLNTPLEFLIQTADGVDATDFQLVHLRAKSDAREFRTMTGGVFHRSGGASRDAVTFTQTRIAKHIYKVTLSPNLPRGEYGFLAPGLTNSSVSGSTGKAYTFRLVE